MVQPDTVERILDAASVLFAERGYAETSVRTITTAAGVNLAAVNYHFGSKKILIQAVFARVLQPFCVELEGKLDQLEQSGSKASAEVLLDCVFKALLDSLLDKRQAEPEKVLRLQRFMRLLGMAYTQAQGHLRRFIVSEYGDVYGRFIQLLKSTAPEAKPIDFYWQLYFMLGATVFTLSSIDSIQGIIQDNFASTSSIDRAMDLLVPTLAKMVKPIDG